MFKKFKIFFILIVLSFELGANTSKTNRKPGGDFSVLIENNLSRDSFKNDYDLKKFIKKEEKKLIHNENKSWK